MSSEENKKDKFTFIEEEDRPYIASSSASPFRVGDTVYLTGSDGSRDGPFLVASVSGQTCTLSLENGQAAKNAEEIKMTMLEAV
ncbi:hypothetical protein V8C37DRAFT_368327 [Trichoderma ceciliae]